MNQPVPIKACCRNLPKARQIIAEICSRHGVSRRELLSTAKHKYLAPPRKECWQSMRLAKMSYREIGQICNRDESSIRAGVKEGAQ